MWQDIARRQAGLVRRDQLHQCGLTDRQIASILRRGDLRRAGPRGMFVVSGAPTTQEAAWWTAVLVTRGVLSHLSAARSWDLPVPEGAGVHVTVAAKATPAATHGIVVHRLPLPAAADRFGLPVTTRAQTVLD